MVKRSVFNTWDSQRTDIFWKIKLQSSAFISWTFRALLQVLGSPVFSSCISTWKCPVFLWVFKLGITTFCSNTLEALRTPRAIALQFANIFALFTVNTYFYLWVLIHPHFFPFPVISIQNPHLAGIHNYWNNSYWEYFIFQVFGFSSAPAVLLI